MTKKAKLVILSAIVVAVLVFVTILVLTPHSSQKTTSTASSATKGEVAEPPSVSPNPSQSSSTPSTPDQNTPPPSSKDNAPSDNAPLLDPSGTFVSNHRPNISGNPAPNTIQSVCTTTPGASCQITFTKDGVTKSLHTQKTDNGGAAYWSWKLQDLGLTAGSWHVQAKATLGAQTKIADDALALEVSP